MSPKILFLSEAVTSAHFLRPWNLAKILIKNNYDVYFASTQFPLNIIKDDRIKCFNLLDSITPKIFLESIKWGKLPFTYKVVANKLKEDLNLIDIVKPDIIIDDFRLTSSIATEMLNLKHITICNFNWLPNFYLNTEVIPELEQFKIFGKTLGVFAYSFLKNTYINNILKPFNKLRIENKLNTISSLTELYAGGKNLFVLDSVDLVKRIKLNKNHTPIGPLICTVESANLPSWWNELDSNIPIIYFSLGSSGDHRIIKSVLNQLKSINASIIVSGVENKSLINQFPNVYFSHVLPDHLILPKVNIYIGNGGSGGIQQALNSQVSVICLPSNYDQWSYSMYLEEQKLVNIIRPSELGQKNLNSLVLKLLNPVNKNNFKKIDLTDKCTSQTFLTNINCLLNSDADSRLLKRAQQN